jgi:hypothetical protein
MTTIERLVEAVFSGGTAPRLRNEDTSLAAVRFVNSSLKRSDVKYLVGE